MPAMIAPTPSDLSLPLHVVACASAPTFDAFERVRARADELGRKALGAGRRVVLSVADPEGFRTGGVPGVTVEDDNGCTGLSVRFWTVPVARFARELGADADLLILEDGGALGVLRPILTRETRVCVLSGEVPPGFEPDISPGIFEAFDVVAPGLLRTTRTRPAATRATQCGDVLVIGAGLAGAFIAVALADRGWRPIVVDAGRAPASEASALYAGLFHPHWQASDSPVFQLTRAGCRAMAALRSRVPEAFVDCGVLDVASDAAEWEHWCEAVRRGVPFPMPEREARLVGRDEAAQLCGLAVSRGGWWFPGSGIVHPSLLSRRLLELAGASLLVHTPVHLRRDCMSGLWEAVTAEGAVVARAGHAVVAAAGGSPEVFGMRREDYGLTRLYGRISLLRDTDLSTLKTALTGAGYVVRLGDGFTAAGATYEPDGPNLSAPEAHAHNLEVFERLLDEQPELLVGGFYEGERAVPLDRMPIVGRLLARGELEKRVFRGRPAPEELPVEPGLWGLFGLGSRGLSWGWLCAEVLADAMTGLPPRIPASLSAALHPARFAARRCGDGRLTACRSTA